MTIPQEPPNTNVPEIDVPDPAPDPGGVPPGIPPLGPGPDWREPEMDPPMRMPGENPDVETEL